MTGFQGMKKMGFNWRLPYWEHPWKPGAILWS